MHIPLTHGISYIAEGSLEPCTVVNNFTLCNTFMLLNIDKDNGVMGWTMLPVYEMDRIENGQTSSYSVNITTNNTSAIKQGNTHFVWIGHNDGRPYLNWQVAHLDY